MIDDEKYPYLVSPPYGDGWQHDLTEQRGPRGGAWTTYPQRTSMDSPLQKRGNGSLVQSALGQYAAHRKLGGHPVGGPGGSFLRKLEIRKNGSKETRSGNRAKAPSQHARGPARDGAPRMRRLAAYRKTRIDQRHAGGALRSALSLPCTGDARSRAQSTGRGHAILGSAGSRTSASLSHIA